MLNISLVKCLRIKEFILNIRALGKEDVDSQPPKTMHYKKISNLSTLHKKRGKFCVTNSLNIKVVRKTKKLHIYKCVDLISKVHVFKCVIFVVKKVHTLKRELL